MHMNCKFQRTCTWDTVSTQTSRVNYQSNVVCVCALCPSSRLTQLSMHLLTSASSPCKTIKKSKRLNWNLQMRFPTSISLIVILVFNTAKIGDSSLIWELAWSCNTPLSRRSQWFRNQSSNWLSPMLRRTMIPSPWSEPIKLDRFKLSLHSLFYALEAVSSSKPQSAFELNWLQWHLYLVGHIHTCHR